MSYSTKHTATYGSITNSQMNAMTPRQITDPPTPAIPFLRWAGSKRQHLNLLEQYWSPTFKRYVEPFVGSASFFFRLEPKAALLNDLNTELIQTFRTVTRVPKQVHQELEALPRGRRNFYRVRALESKGLSAPKRAARFIYLNRFCFNGLFRTNRLGKFNVPYGAPKTDNVPSEAQLITCAKHLRKAKLISGDFREVLKLVRRDDFVYLDPPYAISNRRAFVEYGANPFSLDDLPDLKRQLNRIHKLGAFFVLHYADCSEARKMFSRWSQRRILAKRNVAGSFGARGNRFELCITNIKQGIRVGSTEKN